MEVPTGVFNFLQIKTPAGILVLWRSQGKWVGRHKCYEVVSKLRSGFLCLTYNPLQLLWSIFSPTHFLCLLHRTKTAAKV